MTDCGAVEVFFIADNGAVEMPEAVAMAAHVKFQRLLKGRRIKPFLEERCRELFDSARSGCRFLPFGRSSALGSIDGSIGLLYANRFRDGTVGPSAVKPKGKQSELYYGKDEFPMPRAMTEEEIADAIDGVAGAAQHAISVAGFDGIEPTAPMATSSTSS